jgi:hypothetical protein
MIRNEPEDVSSTWVTARAARTLRTILKSDARTAFWAAQQRCQVQDTLPPTEHAFAIIATVSGDSEHVLRAEEERSVGVLSGVAIARWPSRYETATRTYPWREGAASLEVPDKGPRGARNLWVRELR